MTERKPREMSIPSWIDKQIQDATERGAFDNLPGTGKPLPSRGAFSAEAWARDYLRREGMPGEDALPTPLRLRKESERLAETVHLLRSEQEVRGVVADLNDRIRTFRRLPDGPPMIVRLVDEDEMVRRWHESRVVPRAEGADASGSEPEPRRRFSWRRRGRP
jgi:DnaJ-like protein